MPVHSIPENSDISPEERGFNNRARDDDVSDFSIDDGSDQSTEKGVDEEEEIFREELHDPVNHPSQTPTSRTGTETEVKRLFRGLGSTEIDIRPDAAGPDDPKSRIREESDELRPSTNPAPNIGENTAYTRSQLAKVSLQFGIGMLILVALGLWGVSAGVMAPAPTFAIAFIGAAAAVFSLVLWYSIR